MVARMEFKDKDVVDLGMRPEPASQTEHEKQQQGKKIARIDLVRRQQSSQTRCQQPGEVIVPAADMRCAA